MGVADRPALRRCQSNVTERPQAFSGESCCMTVGELDATSTAPDVRCQALDQAGKDFEYRGIPRLCGARAGSGRYGERRRS